MRQLPSPADEIAISVLPGTFVVRGYDPALVVKSVRCGGEDCTDRAIEVTGDRSDIVVTFTNAAATVTGVVNHATGAPAHAVVIVFPQEPEQWVESGATPTRIRTGVTAAAGAFEISSLPAGYLLVAVPAEQRELWRDPAFLKRASGHATRVTLRWGERITQGLTVATVR